MSNSRRTFQAWRGMLVALCLVPAPPTSGQDAAPTSKPSGCQEITDRILAPDREKLSRAERALKEYKELNDQNIKRIQERIALLQGTAKEFEAARAEQEKKYRNYIRLNEEAVGETIAEAQKRIAALRKEAAEWRAKNREDRARGADEAAARVEKLLAEGKCEYFKKALGVGSDLNGWRRGVKENNEALAKTMAEFAAGTYAIHVKALAHGANWKQILEEIAQFRAELAKAEKGELPYFLHTLGYGQNRKQVEDLVKLCDQKLAELEKRITDGTYAVFVPALGYQADRNTVQRLISEAIEKQWRAGPGLKAGLYKNARSKAGELTSGQLKQKLADLRKQYAAADDSFKFADAQRIELEIQKTQESQRDLERLAQEDQSVQRKELDGRLADALNQTPCGGHGEHAARNPTLATVQKHRRQISSLTEKEEDPRKRLIDYDDAVYIEDEGTVHGDLKRAWAWAMRVTKTRPAERTGWDQAREAFDIPPSQSNAELVQEFKDLVDWLAGYRDLKGLLEAQLSIEQFMQDVKNLDPAKLDPQTLAAVQERIAKHLKAFEEMFTTGAFSEERLRDYEKALRGAGQAPEQLQEQLRKLYQLRRVAHAADRVFWSGGALKSVVQGIGRQSLEQYRTFVAGSGKDVSQRIKAWGAEMKTFDRGMLALGVIAAGADAYDQMDKGVPPSEAVARSSVSLTIDLAVNGVPLLAAAEIATQVSFNGMAYATGDKSWSDAVPSNVIKVVAQEALSQVAAGATVTGEYEGELERVIFNEPSIDRLLSNVDRQRVQDSLTRTEAQLAALVPGAPEEKRLLRMRASFRRMLRTK